MECEGETIIILSKKSLIRFQWTALWINKKFIASVLEAPKISWYSYLIANMVQEDELHKDAIITVHMS